MNGPPPPKAIVWTVSPGYVHPPDAEPVQLPVNSAELYQEMLQFQLAADIFKGATVVSNYIVREESALSSNKRQYSLRLYVDAYILGCPREEYHEVCVAVYPSSQALLFHQGVKGLGAIMPKHLQSVARKLVLQQWESGQRDCDVQLDRKPRVLDMLVVRHKTDAEQDISGSKFMHGIGLIKRDFWVNPLASVRMSDVVVNPTAMRKKRKNGSNTGGSAQNNGISTGRGYAWVDGFMADLAEYIAECPDMDTMRYWWKFQAKRLGFNFGQMNDDSFERDDDKDDDCTTNESDDCEHNDENFSENER